jgi:hypothetical protein
MADIAPTLSGHASHGAEDCFPVSAVLAGRYSNGKVWAISAKNSATGTEIFGGKVDEAAQTLKDPQWGTQYSLVDGSVVGKWCPSPPLLGSRLGTVFPARGVWVPQVREQGGYVEVLIDVDAKVKLASPEPSTEPRSSLGSPA